MIIENENSKYRILAGCEWNALAQGQRKKSAWLIWTDFSAG